jgi:hypothetical protein
MVKIRDLIESLCQKLDIFDPSGSRQDLDKCNLEEFVRSQGGGKSALASITVATRAMLGKRRHYEITRRVLTLQVWNHPR